jgi:hypothetical protein
MPSCISDVRIFLPVPQKLLFFPVGKVPPALHLAGGSQDHSFTYIKYNNKTKKLARFFSFYINKCNTKKNSFSTENIGEFFMQISTPRDGDKTKFSGVYNF